MEFQFIRQGTLYSVRTEVGDGPADVKVVERELTPQGDDTIEHSDEVLA